MNYLRRACRFVRKKFSGSSSSYHSDHRAHTDGYIENSSGTDINNILNGANIGSNNQMVNQLDPVHFLHGDAVTSVKAVGPSLSLSGGKDNIAALYDYKRKTIEAKWTGHTREVTKVLQGPDESYFSASRDKTISLWRACPSSGASMSLRAYTGHDLVVTAIDVTSDYERLCSGGRDNSMKLWDVETASCLRSVAVSRNLVTDLKLGHERPIIVQTSEDKELHLWDARNLSIIQTFRKKMYIQTSCDLDEEDMYCLTTSNGFGGYGCEATLWDLRAVEPVLEYHGHRETVGACAFIPPMGGRELVMTSSHDATIRVWEKQTAECLICLSVDGAGPLTSIAVGPANTFLVSSFNRGVIRLQMAEKNAQLQLSVIDVF